MEDISKIKAKAVVKLEKYEDGILIGVEEHEVELDEEEAQKLWQSQMHA